MRFPWHIPDNFLMICLMSNIQGSFSFIVSDCLVDVDLFNQIPHNSSISSGSSYTKGVITCK